MKHSEAMSGRPYSKAQKTEKSLESVPERYNAIILAYCLIDNHYHLFLETPSGNASKIIAYINGSEEKTVCFFE